MNIRGVHIGGMELLRQSKEYIRYVYGFRARILECTKEEEGCIDTVGFE